MNSSPRSVCAPEPQFVLCIPMGPSSSHYSPSSCAWLLLLVVIVGTQFGERAAAADPETIDGLKRSLNRLLRQQDIELSRYRSRVASIASAELRESVFALSEVFGNCGVAVAGVQSLFDAAGADCTSKAPHTPQSIAEEAASDLHGCLREVEEAFVAVTRPLEESLSAAAVASTKLNFWLQSKLFAVTPSLSPLDTFDAAAAARETFNEAVLWDNVGSFGLYRAIEEARRSFRDAGEWGFVCGLMAFNKLWAKSKSTENFLNTQCVE